MLNILQMFFSQMLYINSNMLKSDIFTSSSKIFLRLFGSVSAVCKSHLIQDIHHSLLITHLIIYQFLPVLCPRCPFCLSAFFFAIALILITYFISFPTSSLVLSGPTSEFAPYAILSNCHYFAYTFLIPGCLPWVGTLQCLLQG